MFTAHLEAICFSGHHQMLLWGAPYLNKSEQVSIYHHQMSLTGASQVWCPEGTLPDLPWGLLHLTCDLSHDVIDITYHHPYQWTDRYLWKHYHPASLFTGGNNKNIARDKGAYSLTTEMRS